MKDVNIYILITGLIIIALYIGLLIRFKIENVKWTLKTFCFFISMPFLVFVVLPIICPIHIIRNVKGIRKISLSIKMVFLIIVFNQKVFDVLMIQLDKADDNEKIFVTEHKLRDLPKKLTDDFCTIVA